MSLTKFAKSVFRPVIFNDSGSLKGCSIPKNFFSYQEKVYSVKTYPLNLLTTVPEKYILMQKTSALGFRDFETLAFPPAGNDVKNLFQFLKFPFLT